jgi:hypothetical protein
MSLHICASVRRVGTELFAPAPNSFASSRSAMMLLIQ